MNLNDIVTVTLTERGAAIYNAYMEQFPEKIRLPVVESGQPLKTQLWNLFQIFGQHIYLGSTAPFNDCEIDTGKDEIESLRAQLAQAEINAALDRDDLAEAQEEIQEQARLNGMGSEREAKLMAQLLATQAHAARLVEALKFLDERIITSAELSGVARAALSTPINLDALHEDRARTLEEASKNWIYGSTFNVLNEMAAAHRARKEQK